MRPRKELKSLRFEQLEDRIALSALPGCIAIVTGVGGGELVLLIAPAMGQSLLRE